jgi:transcriptional regulator of NAD metabolism
MLSRAVTITNDEDMDAIIDDTEDKNFSIQQENDRTHSETLK